MDIWFGIDISVGMNMFFRMNISFGMNIFSRMDILNLEWMSCEMDISFEYVISF